MEEKSGETVLFGLSKSLFWDVDLSTLDAQKHAAFIIEKVLFLGTMHDFLKTKAHYGKPLIKSVAKNLRYMNDREHHFCSVYFNLPLNQFRCYTTKQSNQTHWNY